MALSSFRWRYLTDLLRLREWASITFLPLLSTSYFLLLAEGRSFVRNLWDTSLIILFGLFCGSFAFVANTLFDREQDQRASKTYLLSKWRPKNIVALMLLLLALSAVVLVTYVATINLITFKGMQNESPGIGLAIGSQTLLVVSLSTGLTVHPDAARSLMHLEPYRENARVLSLATFAIILAFIYSVPPFRLKERGVLGVLTIAISEFALPQTLMFATYGQVGLGMILFSVLFFWVGLRMILLHQLLDFGNDMAGNVQTFVSTFGAERVLRLVVVVVVPFEAISIILTMIYASTRIPGVPIFVGFCLITFFLYGALQHKLDAISPPVYFTAPFDFYFLLWPLFILGLGLARSWIFLILIVFHLGLAYPYWIFHYNNTRWFTRKLSRQRYP